jgi:hypothetical protein
VLKKRWCTVDSNGMNINFSLFIQVCLISFVCGALRASKKDHHKFILERSHIYSNDVSVIVFRKDQYFREDHSKLQAQTFFKFPFPNTNLALCVKFAVRFLSESVVSWNGGLVDIFSESSKQVSLLYSNYKLETLTKLASNPLTCLKDRIAESSLSIINKTSSTTSEISSFCQIKPHILEHISLPMLKVTCLRFTQPSQVSISRPVHTLNTPSPWLLMVLNFGCLAIVEITRISRVV